MLLYKQTEKKSDSQLIQDQALNTIVKKNKRIKDLEAQQRDIWTALMDRSVADSKRRKDTLDAAAASSSNQPPPPPPDKPKIIQNPVVPMPSSQPSGVSVSGKERAVQPNGGLQIPANLPPSTNKTREDDKPLNKTMREGADPAVRKKAQKQTEAGQKRKRENSRDNEEREYRARRKANPPPPPQEPAKSSTPAPDVKKKITKEKRKPIDLTKEPIDLTKDEKTIDLTKDDDKPPPAKAKSKSKAPKLKRGVKGGAIIRTLSRPGPKNKPAEPTRKTESKSDKAESKADTILLLL